MNVRGVVVLVFLVSLCWWEAFAQESQGEEYVVADFIVGFTVYTVTGEKGVAINIKDVAEIEVIPYNITSTRIPSRFRTTNGIEDKGVSIVLNNTEASIMCATVDKIGFFSPLPVSVLGRKYIFTSYYSRSTDPGYNYMYVLVIAAHSFRTEVNITFNLQDSVTYDNNMYSDGETLSLTLKEHNTFTLRTDADLTGSLVISQQNIAVFSGIAFNGLVSAGAQLLPLHHFGQEYVVAVDDRSNYTLQILSEHRDTQISFNDGSTVNVDSNGIYRQSLSPSDILHFTSSRPVMTTLCRINGLYSTLCIVPPVDIYTTHTGLYYFGSGFKILTTKDAVISARDSSGKMEAESWEDIPGSDYKVGNWSWSGRYSSVDISSDAKFTVIGYTYYAQYSTGYSFKSTSCTPLIIEEDTSKLVTVSVVCSVIIIVLLAVIVGLVWRLYKSSKRNNIEDNYEHVAPRHGQENPHLYGHIGNTGVQGQDNAAHSPDDGDDVELEVQNSIPRGSDDVDERSLQYEHIE